MYHNSKSEEKKIPLLFAISSKLGLSLFICLWIAKCFYAVKCDDIFSSYLCFFGCACVLFVIVDHDMFRTKMIFAHFLCSQIRYAYPIFLGKLSGEEFIRGVSSLMV